MRGVGLLCVFALLAACAGAPRDPLLSSSAARAAAKVETVLDKSGTFRPGGTGWVRAEDGYRSTVSGLVCPETLTLFEDDTRAVARLLGIAAYRADGTDASCNYQAPRLGTVLTVYATHAPGTDADRAFADARDAIAARFAGADEIALPPPTIPGATVNAAAFGVRQGGGNPYDRATAVWMASADPWHVKVRATYPAAEAGAEAAGADALRAAASAVLPLRTAMAAAAR